MQNSKRIPGSFRDPSGFLFFQEGRLYRQVNKIYREHYDHLMASGLYHALANSKLLIPHQEVEATGIGTAHAYKVIRPEPIPFISYPYEWSFSQLRGAALLTLAIQKKALEFGMSLKDSSAYNVQFREGQPIFIDTLSFEVYREGQPWVAYRQFCQHFLGPLSLMSYRDIRLNQLLRIYIDGIPLDLASSLLPTRSLFNFGLLSHIHLHAKSQRHFARKSAALPDRTMNRLSLLGLIDSLERTIKRMQWQPQGTEWIDYVQDTNYSPKAWQHKQDVVATFLDRSNPEIVWDLGANTGLFSRIAAAKGTLTISADADPACVEVNYLQCVRERESRVLPLLIDLTNPSPGVGWANTERMSLIERGPADTVLALALLHHLAISNNLPFADIAGFFAQICRWLIIEFVPKSDPRVQQLLATRKDIFAEYTQSTFEKTFRQRFEIIESVKLQDSARTLYLMRALQR